MMEKAPVFIKVREYQRLLKNIDALAQKIGTVEEMLDTIEKLKVEEDGQLQRWKENLENVKVRLANVGNALYRN
jgi:hypothetical protein